MSNKIEFLQVAAEKIAYFYAEPKKHDVTVMFLHGFLSSMHKTKALYLRDFCVEKGYGFLSLDYSGHGESSGVFEDKCISDWLKDCQAVIQHTGARKLLIVGSSLGGWMMLHLALRLSQLVVGLIGIGVAPDFTKDIPLQMTQTQRKELKEAGKFIVSGEYNDIIITQNLLINGDKLLLLGKGGIACNVPVRLLHGVNDIDSPFQRSMQLMQELTSTDVEIVLVKDGDHSLSAPDNLKLLSRTVMALAEQL